MANNLQCQTGEFLHENRCCHSCQKGEYVQSPCQESTQTKCLPCHHDHFRDGVNFLRTCQPCKACDSSSFKVTARECSAEHDRECKCKEGFYCIDSECELCLPVTECPPGYGVHSPPTGTTDTVCAECTAGTHNNVTDSKTACLPHTKCADLGLEVKSPGTKYLNAVCAPKRCHWFLPASLWVGLALTVLIIGFAYLYWKKKHRSKNTANTSVLPSDAVPLHITDYKLQYPVPCKDGEHCCPNVPFSVEIHPSMKSLDLEKALDPGLPTLTLPESIVESAPRDSMRQHVTTSVCQSEPQEDEWSGT